MFTQYNSRDKDWHFEQRCFDEKNMQRYISMRDGSRYARLRLFCYYAQRVLISRRLRRAATRATIAGLDALHGSAGRASRRSPQPIMAMKNKGYLQLGKLLSEPQCAEIRAYLRNQHMIAMRGNRQSFKMDNVPEGVSLGDFPLESVVNCPHVMELANHRDVLAMARDYLGYTPTVTLMGIRCTFPSANTDADVQSFHRDVEPGSIKLMVYLTDVDEQSGPHSYVQGTHLDRMPLRMLRYSDHDIARTHGGGVTITGPAGTAFAIDNRGIHKGTPPVRGMRLLLVIQYSLLPCLVYEYEPVAYRGRQCYDPYINRLMIAERAGVPG
jgi:hypothetical protein